MEKLAKYAFYVLLGFGLWLMGSASASYLDLDETHPFFLEKLPLAHPSLWLGALYLHVPSALVALPACLVLLSNRVRIRWPRFHRWLGRVTGALILLVMVPSGMYLALFAQGGWVSTLGFWLTGGITFVAMLRSIQTARERDLQNHRRFSAHVTAQLSVAVTSRLMLAGADLAGAYQEWVYVAALWVPVVVSLVVAEQLTTSVRSRFRKGSRHEIVAAVRPHAVH